MRFNNFSRIFVQHIENYGVIIAVLLAMGFVLGLIAAGSEFGNELLPEILGMSYTIFIIDFMIKRGDRARTRPVRDVINRECIKICNEIEFFWLKVVKASAEERPEPGEDLFSRRYIEISRHLDITTRAPIYPSALWSQYIQAEATATRARIESVIQRYHGNMDADLIGMLYAIDDDAILGLMSRAGMFRSDIFMVDMTEEFLCKVRTLYGRISKDALEFSRESRRIIGILDGEHVAVMLRDDISPALGSGRSVRPSAQ